MHNGMLGWHADFFHRVSRGNCEDGRLMVPSFPAIKIGMSSRNRTLIIPLLTLVFNNSILNMIKTKDRSKKQRERQSEKELKRRWDEKAKRILSHLKVQKPQQREFRSKTIVRSLLANQRSW